MALLRLKNIMNKCPITYEECGNDKYSKKGLLLLSKKLLFLNDFPYTSQDQRDEALNMMSKISIQGVQPKLSVTLDIKNQIFKLTDINGQYILKPQHNYYTELPENEDLTMKMASLINIETPIHGLIYSKDKSLTYFIKRFDRLDKNKKLSVEDFSQLSELTRETKYDYTMEKIVKLIDSYCTFPALEKVKLFRLIIFSYLVGNEDMHLKNFSIINRNSKIELSPAYDLLNTTIILKNPKEEMPLSISGKKSNLNYNIFVDYFAYKRLELNTKSVENIFAKIKNSIEEWESLIKKSFLSDKLKNDYLFLLEKRIKKLNL